MTKFYSESLSNAQKVNNSNNSTNFPRFGQQVISSSSKLIGHIIGQVDVWVSNCGGVSGTVYCRIRKGSDDSIACEIGNLDASTITKGCSTPNNPTTFGPNNSNTYALVAGDKILIEYSGGNSSNYLRCGDTGSGNTPYESGSNSRSVEYWSSQGYYLQNNPRDWAANFWDAIPSTPPPPPPPPPGGATPTAGYTSNTAKDLAGNFWTIGTGTPPPPPAPSPPPPTSPPPPSPISMFYNIPSPSSHSGRFLSGSGSAGSSQGYIRVGEIANSSSSQIVGKVVKEVDFVMEKIGSPKGTLTVTIRKGSDDSIAATMGTLDVSSMQNNYKTYTFSNFNNVYTLQKNDKIMAEFSGGNSSNYLGVDENNNDPYDGKNTCSVYYTVSKVYNTNTSKDISANFWA